MSVLMEFPLSYRVYCKPFRRRTTGSVSLLDIVTLPVREVSAEDAPLAVRLTDGSGGERLRWCDGKYWIADQGDGFASGRLRARLLAGTESDAESLANDSMFIRRHFPYVFDRFQARIRTTPESERCREVTGDDRTVSFLRLEELVGENMMAVDGVIHMAVNEPFRTLYIADDGQVGATISLGMPYMDGGRNRMLAFPLDRLDDYEAVVASLAEREGIVVRDAIIAEYLFGATTHVKREREDLVAVTDEWVDSAGFKIREWPKDRAMAWFDLRDAFQVSEEERHEDETLLDDMAAGLAAYGAHVDIGPFARIALERWHMRQIEFEAAMGIEA